MIFILHKQKKQARHAASILHESGNDQILMITFSIHKISLVPFKTILAENSLNPKGTFSKMKTITSNTMPAYWVNDKTMKEIIVS